MSSRRRAIMGISKSSGRLPSAYQEVEYIDVQNSLTYVNTGVKATNNIKAEVKYSPLSIPEGSGNSTFGAKIGSNRFQIYTSPARVPSVGLGYAGVNIYELATETSHIVIIDSLNVTVSVDSVVISGNFTNNTPSELDIYVGISNNTDAPINYGNSRFYYCKLWKNNTLVRNFIPCYRKSDNKPGMYDLVNDVFYVNANTSASQDFIVGPNV